MAVASDSKVLKDSNNPSDVKLELDWETNYQLRRYLDNLFVEYGRISTFIMDSMETRLEFDSLIEDIQKIENIIRKLLSWGSFGSKTQNAEIVKEIANLIEELSKIKPEDYRLHRHSLFFIGFCYLKGIGVEKNSEKAKAFIDSAREQGYGFAVNVYINCFQGMSGENLDWESRYQLKFYLGQLEQELYRLRREALRNKSSLLIPAVSSSHDKADEITANNAKLMMDVNETRDLILTILNSKNNAAEENKALLDKITNLANSVSTLPESEQGFLKHRIFLLGYLPHRGIAVAQNDNQAWAYFKMAADLGFGKAQYYLARYYMTGFANIHDIKPRVKELLVDLNTPEVLLCLAECELNGFFQEANPSKGLHYWILAVNHGYGPAQFFFTNRFSNPEDLKRFNEDKRRPLLRKLAADQGWLPAILSHAYSLWKITDINFQPYETLQYFQKAVNLGCHFIRSEIKGAIREIEWYLTNPHPAQTPNAPIPFTPDMLAIIYYEGIGVPKDKAKAEQYMKMAVKKFSDDMRADQCNASFRFNMTFLYLNRKDYYTESDATLAKNWKMYANYVFHSVYLRAIDSQYNAAENLTARDPLTAVNRYLRSCQETMQNGDGKPDDDTLHNLRWHYQNGVGVTQNNQTAMNLAGLNRHHHYRTSLHPDQFSLVSNAISDAMGIQVPYSPLRYPVFNQEWTSASAYQTHSAHIHVVFGPDFSVEPSTPLSKSALSTSTIAASVSTSTASNALAPNSVSAAVASTAPIGQAALASTSKAPEPLPSYPELSPRITLYYQLHCEAYFHELAGRRLQALQCLDQSLSFGNEESRLRRDILAPMWEIRKQLQTLGESNKATRGFNFLLPALQDIVVEYAFDDAENLRGPKTGPIGKYNK